MRSIWKETYDKNAHTFVVCAYGDSPYLEECVCSLLAQKVKTRILVSTSTPTDSIASLAHTYQLPLFINRGDTGLGGDWNFAMRCSETPLVTLAHQDDRYEENYTERVLTVLNACRHPLLAFTDYYELRDGQRVESNHLLRVKRRMLLPMQVPFFWKSRFLRRRILSLGNPICCPSVTLVKENLPEFVFTNSMKSNLDWQAWEEISRKKGEFAYVPSPCMEHRIHFDSATSRVLKTDGRWEEDLQVLRRFWPEGIARRIEGVYRKAERSNE
ncbi:MAG: glycosyltransferase [Lachnospiraceae bacterium]|nr:glycosyltransferase [Lachnospiraceae bacterium]